MGWRGWLGVACLVLLWGTRHAFAHAVLLSSDPVDGAMLHETPRAVAFRLNEPVQWLEVKVLDASGTSLAPPAAARLMTPELSVVPHAPLRPGAYWAMYRVLSADSHVISGAIAFAIVGPTETRTPSELPASIEGIRTQHAGEPWMQFEAARTHGHDLSPRALLVTANRTAQLAGALLSMGIALYLLLVRGISMDARRDLRGMGYSLALLAAVASIFAIGLQGALEIAASPMDLLFHIEPWIHGAGSRRALASILLIAGLLLLGAGWLPQNRLLCGALFSAGTLLILVSFTAVGHVANTLPRWPSVAAWLIHLYMAAFWLGSLLPLMNAVRADQNAPATLKRFSKLAVPAVVLLAAAGAGIAVLQIATWSQLTESSYGQVLIVKVALFCGMLGLAATNRFVLLPGLMRRGSEAKYAIRRALTISIGMEMVAGMLVLVLAA